MKVIKPKAKANKEKKPGRLEHIKDEYRPIFDPSELVIDENRKFVINVQRSGQIGLPCVDIRTFQTTDAYNGFTRKGVNFPLELLPDLIRILEEVSEQADENGLFEEFENEE